MNHLFLALLFLVYFLCVILGASVASGKIFSKLFFHGELPAPYLLPVGFSVFPVLVAWSGFAGIGRVPFLAPCTALVLGAYGIFWTWSSCRTKTFTFPAPQRWWKLYSVPLAIALLLVFSKAGYLLGGHSSGDEGGRILLTTAFAANGLQPAFPLNFSIPLAYPYYMFETSAFLYASVRGLLFPSIPLLAVSFTSLFLFYYSLFLLCRLVFRHDHDEKFFLVSLFLSVSGMRTLLEWIDRQRGVAFHYYQVATLNQFFHDSYHYVWGVTLGAFAVIFLWQFIHSLKKEQWALFVTFFSLSLGFCGISFAWIALGILPLLIDFLARERMRAMFVFAKLIAITIALLLFILGPQFFSMLPRNMALFSFSAPHVWFPRDVARFTSGLMSGLFFGVSVVAVNLGFMLFVGFLLALVVITTAFRRSRNDPEWDALFPFATVIVVSMLLLTFTISGSGDWYGRGFFVSLLFSGFLAAKFFFPLFFASTSARPLSVFLWAVLVVQGWSVILTHRTTVASRAPLIVYQINQAFPFGTIFHQASYTDFVIDAALAGRAALSPPPPGYAAYLLRSDTLKSLGIPYPRYLPCTATWYGKTVPGGVYVEPLARATRYCP